MGFSRKSPNNRSEKAAHPLFSAHKREIGGPSYYDCAELVVVRSNVMRDVIISRSSEMYIGLESAHPAS
jgi:hypothetical protein